VRRLLIGRGRGEGFPAVGDPEPRIKIVSNDDFESALGKGVLTASVEWLSVGGGNMALFRSREAAQAFRIANAGH
jgi:hypothetical protein